MTDKPLDCICKLEYRIVKEVPKSCPTISSKVFIHGSVYCVFGKP